MKKIFLSLSVFIFLVNLNAQDSISFKQAESNVKALAVLWHQHAAEYRALCYQAYNIASLRLAEAVKAKKAGEKLAIITDLDETVLDNSYSEARLIKEGSSYTPASWKQWTDQSAATAVPGAVDFFNEAHKKGVSIFYISNRDTGALQSTLKNLKNLNLPDADVAHALFLQNTSSKEARRQIVMGEYKVIMLVGDNLGDFTAVFDKKNTADRKTETDKDREEWGKKFIVLPNAVYGEWENALYNYDRNLTPAQKDMIRKKALIGY